MKQRTQLLIYVITFFVFAVTSFAGNGKTISSENKNPNIVIILADDFGYELVRANGGESYKTPVLDKLAAEGVRFENAFVQPLCTPTRAQLMTGLYNVRNYVRFGYLPEDQIVFSQLFKKAGYSTAIVGKWQLGNDDNLPEHFGFDESYLWLYKRRGSRYSNPSITDNGKLLEVQQDKYGPQLFADKAVDFIKRKKDVPFLLYYPMVLTHAPYQPVPENADWSPNDYEDKGPSKNKYFASNVEYVDKNTGRVLDALKETGVYDNTLVIFIGDNGTGRGVVSQFNGREYKGGKGTTTNAGTHVPLFVSYPAKFQGHKVLSDLTDSTDIFPTILEAAGIEIPKGLTVDGKSFYQRLIGSDKPAREFSYCWFSMHGGEKATGEFIRDLQYKLYTDGRFFDLPADEDEISPLDKTKLSPEQQKALEKLQMELTKYSDARAKWTYKDQPVQQAAKKLQKRSRKAAQ